MKFCLTKNVHSRTLIATGATLLAGLTLLFFVAWPSYQQIRQLNDEIYQERVGLEKLYQKGQILKQTVQEYEKVKPEVTKLSSVYLQPNDELNLITKLEDAAQMSNVKQHLTLGVQDPKKTKNTLPIQLQISGQLKDFVGYLQKIEGLDYYLNIDSLRLSKNGTGNQSIQSSNPLEAVLLGLIYYQP